jgi:HlyD family secretion protein
LHDEGDLVALGALLAVLDSDELREQRDQAAFAQQKAIESVRLEQAGLARARASVTARQASIAKTVANAELARLTFERFTRLHDRDLIARHDLDIRSTELRAAEADVLNVRAEIAALEAEGHRSEVAVGMAEREVAATGAALAASEARLRDASVVAPFSGLIVSREVEPGTVIVPGVPVFRMIDPATIRVRINLDEGLLGAVRLGQPAELMLRSRPERTFRGEVVRIREESDRVAEELSVEIRFLEAPPRLRIGEQADARIITRVVAQGRAVPGSALIQDEAARPAVFVVENGQARQRPVTIGARDPRSGAIELTSGIADGERVVVGPVPSSLKDGQRLRPSSTERR